MSKNERERLRNENDLNALIHPLRRLDNYTNLGYLAIDYLIAAALVAGTACLCHYRAAWGISWWLLVPIVGLAMLLIGACQHRLGGLGHEGAHYLLLKNRVLNELISDWFCMFPVLTTTEQYRQIHLGHHQYTNDWQRDPELLNVGETRRMADFPMSRWQFFKTFGLGLFWPPTLIRYTWDMLYVSGLGLGIHPYVPDDAPPRRPGRSLFDMRLATMLGLAYVALMAGIIGYIGYFGSGWQLAVSPIVLMVGASIGVWALPAKYFFRSKLKPPYSNKITSVMRLGWFTGLQTAISATHFITGVEIGVYFWLLWIVPLNTSFPYLMLLRDLVQHANADDGKLTNSRVVFCNPLIRWAMFIYGQDAHLTHHLYPAIPHYNLPRLHRLLKEHDREYAQHAVECHGFAIPARPGAPTALEVMSSVEPVSV